jgi:hypothetical protein
MHPPELDTERPARRFTSKVDAWLVLVIAAGLLAMWLAPFGRVRAGRPIDALDFALPMLATAFIVWLFRTTAYVVTEDSLVVRSGPVRKTVPLGSITRLRATRNPLSSPALSLDRIEVTYGTRRVLISPKDKQGFLEAVLERSPAVNVEGLP